MGRVSIKEIGQLTLKGYVGYLWWSDKEEPELLIDGHGPDKLPIDGENPFVVEGQLYNKNEDISYSIKYVDGKYVVKKYTGIKEDIENKDNEEKVYLSNRMDGRWLKFLRYWEEKSDEPDKDSFPVLTQTKNVFIGFTEPKKEEKSL